MKKTCVAFGVILAVLLAIVLIVKHTVAEAEKKVDVVTEYVPQIIYYDDETETQTYKAVYCELTVDEREWIAELVAGKAVDRTQTCQQFVANVIFNEIFDCDGDICRAVKKYQLSETNTPTDETYEAVDAVFRNGEFLLDDDVLWFNNSDKKSSFHESLVFVCEIDGVSFYKAHAERSVY